MKINVHSIPCTSFSKINIVPGTALGLRIDGKDLVDDNYIVAIDDMLGIAVARLTKPWLMSDFIFNMSSYKTKLSETLAVASKLTVKVSIQISDLAI